MESNRCERAFVVNTIGQTNGVYDMPLNLRFCDYTNEKSNLKGKSLSAALMSDAKFDGADMSEVVMSKAYAANASFKEVGQREGVDGGGGGGGSTEAGDGERESGGRRQGGG